MISIIRSVNRPMEQISKGNGKSTAISAYSSSVINLNNNLTTSLGVTAQYFTLNNNFSIEPRVALKWKINPKQSLALAYGLHSRREKLDYYYVEKVVNGKKLSNRYLDLSRAHHFGLTYDWNINQKPAFEGRTLFPVSISRAGRGKILFLSH